MGAGILGWLPSSSEGSLEGIHKRSVSIHRLKGCLFTISFVLLLLRFDVHFAVDFVLAGDFSRLGFNCFLLKPIRIARSYAVIGVSAEDRDISIDSCRKRPRMIRKLCLTLSGRRRWCYCYRSVLTQTMYCRARPVGRVHPERRFAVWVSPTDADSPGEGCVFRARGAWSIALFRSPASLEPTTSAIVNGTSHREDRTCGCRYP
jgi:hypothetical protein